MESHALAALYGALIGDAAGGPLEFFRGELKDEHMHAAVSMKGGGRLRLARGQVTDDGELQLALMHALGQSRTGFQRELLENSARAYNAWVRSKPIDCGATCMFGFTQVSEDRDLDEALINIRTHNWESKANGSLMRSLPLAIHYCHRPEMLPNRCYWDGQLSHPNPTCVAACTMYCLTVASLLVDPRDVPGAIARARKWGEAYGPEEVVEWLAEALSANLDDVTLSQGHVKHAFKLAYYHLNNRSTYTHALWDTLRRLGDTDTNACIVGGLVAARAGMTDITVAWRVAVDGTDAQRPAWLSTRGLHHKFERLWSGKPGRNCDR